MKVLFLLLLSGLYFSSCNTPDGYVVKVKISNLNNYKLKISYFRNDKFITDTSYTLEGDWIVFKGKVDEPVVANLNVRGDNPALWINGGGAFIPAPPLQFILSNNIIKIEGDVDSIYMAKVKGGKANKEWNKIRRAQNELTKESWLTLKHAYESLESIGDNGAIEKAYRLREINARKQELLEREFIEKEPESFVSLYFLSKLVNRLTLYELKKAYQGIDKRYDASQYAKMVERKIVYMEAANMEKQAIDINGKPVVLGR